MFPGFVPSIKRGIKNLDNKYIPGRKDRNRILFKNEFLYKRILLRITKKDFFKYSKLFLNSLDSLVSNESEIIEDVTFSLYGFD